ncbi:hypothetical protein B0H14DRAFT_2735359 [Mycena olivaceomarginata]|nr:hypothetical protein B0H14DRAFT_2735359 [Mycena olivaceomarginata]
MAATPTFSPTTTNVLLKTSVDGHDVAVASSSLFLSASNSHGSISPSITKAAAATTSNPTFSPGHSTTTTVLLNTSVDDTDSQNKFHGIWSVVLNDQAYDGSYHITNDFSAFVSFTFDGSAVYLLVSRWTCGVALYVGLDAQPNIRLDLQDQSTPITANCVPVAPPQVLTIANGLSNTTHTLTVRTAPDAAFAVFDGLVYTSVQAQGDEPTLTSADIPMSSSSTAPTTTSPDPTPNHTKPNTKIIPGTIVPSVVAALVGVFGYRKKWHHHIKRLGPRRHRHRHSGSSSGNLLGG